MAYMVGWERKEGVPRKSLVEEMAFMVELESLRHQSWGVCVEGWGVHSKQIAYHAG